MNSKDEAGESPVTDDKRDPNASDMKSERERFEEADKPLKDKCDPRTFHPHSMQHRIFRVLEDSEQVRGTREQQFMLAFELLDAVTGLDESSKMKMVNTSTERQRQYHLLTQGKKARLAENWYEEKDD